ncbi:heavy metal transport/detoxification protein [Parabacteroides sp. OttesenSCG-928-N08]|nr:heavy metal transport/detoxification protein [Parabacteroides sp. OttesenSCG-928-N08]
METLKFKTNAKCGGCEAAIRMKLNNIINDSDWSLDLSDPDKVLTVKSDVSATDIMEAVRDAGFSIAPID